MPDLPAFALALRGYDRRQVDDYVTTLLSYLHEAERRLEQLSAAEKGQVGSQQDAPVPAPVGEPAPVGWPARA